MNITQDIDPLNLVDFIKRKNKIYTKNLLEGLESVLDKDTEEFKIIRKLVLDSQNNFSRMIIKVIIGDEFEGEIK